jgi:hypothetical protein
VEQSKREKLGFHAHPCGGMHFVEALLHLTASQGDAGRAPARRIVEALRQRWEKERTLYARLLAAQPEHGLLLRAQQLKFFGHLLENLGLARAALAPNGGDDAGRGADETARLVAGDLSTTLEQLEAGGVWLRLAQIRAEREQTYLDLIGDGCHAIRGLRRLR